MSSISAMGPQFFHWKSKIWVRGGRSRLALSENIEIYFNDTGSPALIKDPGDFDSIYVVMPMKG